MFRFKRDEGVRGRIAWDCNEKSLDGFSPETGGEADEGSNEPKRSPKLMNPKSYISLSKTT